MSGEKECLKCGMLITHNICDKDAPEYEHWLELQMEQAGLPKKDW